jgi:succinylglutamate desuccinylase
MNSQIRRVAIVGGTHGNELTGVYLIKKFQRSPHLVQRESFETLTLFGNPKAIHLGRRYVDRDLNRCFSPQKLQNLDTYEDFRARELATALANVDVILDLHTTTAKMGLTLLLSSQHPENLKMAAYLTTKHPVKVCLAESSPMLRSLSPIGCTIEVGAIPQGTLNAEIFQQTEALIRTILNYFELRNLGIEIAVPDRLDTYCAIASVDYPRTDLGELEAMTHPELQDYQPLQKGDPMFLTLDRETLPYTGDTLVFPIFVNEAAYYEKGIAMILTEQKTISL